MRRAIVFDFGGVLMKTVDYTPRHTWDRRLGLVRGSVERIVHNATSWAAVQTGQISLADYWADVADQLNISVQMVRQLAVDFYSGDRLDRALIRYIQQWRGDGHAVAMLSNNSIDLSLTLRKEGIIDLFDPLVISAEIGVLKPAAEAYAVVAERLQRPAEELIFIDDAPANIAGANAAGLHGVHYIAGMDLPGALADLLTVK
jgi:FMN phosphatase YigB (HAD superfamily)